jgi:annexin A13
VAVASSYRYDKELVDKKVANAEAAKLHEVIKSKKLDQDDIILILSTRNFHQLRATFACYNQNFGNSIDQVQLLQLPRVKGSFV